MSFTTGFIDLYLRVENYIKEIRVGFPEGLKVYLLSLCNDVGAWFSVHYMTVIVLAVTTALLSLVVYGSWKYHELHNKYLRALEDRDMLKRSRERWVQWYDSASKRADANYYKLVDVTVELDSVKAELEYRITELEEERDEAITDYQEAANDRDFYESELEDARNERDEAQSEVESLTERVETLESVNETYKDLVHELEAAQVASPAQEIT